jgi:hypothetical protein
MFIGFCIGLSWLFYLVMAVGICIRENKLKLKNKKIFKICIMFKTLYIIIGAATSYILATSLLIFNYHEINNIKIIGEGFINIYFMIMTLPIFILATIFIIYYCVRMSYKMNRNFRRQLPLRVIK